MHALIARLTTAHRFTATLAVFAAIGVAFMASDAVAATCYRCTGGWCCY